MAYIHDGTEPVFFGYDPIDPDSTDTFYFAWGDWLRDDETITAAEGVVVGGTKEDGPTYFPTRLGEDGVTYREVYAIQASVTEGAKVLSITCRVSTDQGRLDIDRTIKVPVRSL